MMPLKAQILELVLNRCALIDLRCIVTDGRSTIFVEIKTDKDINIGLVHL